MENPGNDRPVSPTSIPGKVILEVISKHVEENRIIRSSQQGFTKGKSCVSNLIAFYDGMISWLNEGRELNVVYLDFRKAFDTASHNVLQGKLRNCGLDEWRARWMWNWLNGKAQRTVINGSESSWGPVASDVLQRVSAGSSLVQHIRQRLGRRDRVYPKQIC